MAQITFTGTTGTIGNLNANFTELYGYSKNLVSDGSGNVGIGRVPAQVLDVQGAGRTLVRVRGGTGVDQGASFFFTAGSDTTVGAIGEYGSIYGGALQTATAIYSAGFLSLGAGGAERARIDTSGNMLLGSATLIGSAALQVTGTGISVRAPTLDTNALGASNGGLLVSNYATAVTALVAGGSATSTTLAFYTANTAAPVERMRLDSGGLTVVSGSFGYGTGSGGTVTQATSKSTGVTLNKSNGTITMNAASLGATTSVSFVLTNSFIAATDVVNVAIKSGATLASYFVQVDATAAGSCTITVRNYTGGSLAEAIVLSFAVLKAVAA